VVPDQNWTGLLAVSSLLLIAVIAVWEFMCRRWEYRPTLNDNSYLWATQRARIEHDPEAVVLIGSSRMLFDMNLDAFEEVFGKRPIQLATVGTNPGPYLEHLAQHPTFRGTILMGVTPGLFYAPAGPPIDNPMKNLNYYKKWSPSDKVGGYLGVLLQERLAFIQQEDLSLVQLLKQIKLPDRPAAILPPKLPPYFYTIERDRQVRMIPYDTPRKLATRQEVIDGWIPLFTPPPFPSDWSEEQIKGAVEGMVKERIEKTRAWVEQFRAKGGKIVFIRFPSAGGLKELEDKLTPRDPFWDGILQATGAPGIHYEDHEALRGFDCPEWSHLTAADAEEFTRRLIPLVKSALN
jgi:hypothetical protein